MKIMTGNYIMNELWRFKTKYLSEIMMPLKISGMNSIFQVLTRNGEIFTWGWDFSRHVIGIVCL